MKTNGGTKKLGWKFVILFLLWNLSLFLPDNVMALEEENAKEENSQEEKIEEEIISNETVSEEDPSIKEEKTLEEQQEESVEVSLSILDEFDRALILNQYSENMNFIEENVQIYGMIGEYILVADLLENIDSVNLMKDYPFYSIYIVNKDGKILKEEDFIESNSQIILIGEELIASYSIYLVGDYNEDAIVNNEDRDYIVNQILTQPEEEYTLEDASYIDYVLENNTYDIPEISSEEVLESKMQVIDTTNVVENIEIQYSIQGLNKNYINGISGFIQYNHDVLELENVFLLVDGKIIGGFQENYFMYLLEPFTSTSPLLLFQFKPLKSGTTTITLDKIKASMNGMLLELDSSVTIDFIIEDYGKGGDIGLEQENGLDSSNTLENKEISSVPINLENPTSIATSTPEIEFLYQDTSIRNLEIKGYSIDFDKDCHLYYIDVNSTVDSLELNVLLNSPFSSYEIKGNQDFQIGINEVILVVYALDGSTKNYIIEVNKKENKVNLEENTVKKESFDWRIPIMILVALIIVVAIGVLHFIFKEEE